MTFNENKVREAIETLKDYQQVNLWNDRCIYENCMDDYIENNDPDEFLHGKTPTEILSAVHTKEYSLHDSWACDTIYGYVSFNYLEDENSPFDIDEIISWYCDNEGYWETDMLDYEELIEDEEEDADED